MEYSIACTGSSYLFGCVGLRKKRYCIFNKQYTKEEYEALVPKIIAHMNEMPYTDKSGMTYKYGEFFPIELSPVSYNESMAQEYFPLDKEDTLTKGYKWQDTADRNYKPTIEAKDLPDQIGDVDDSITKEIIACAHSKSNCKHLCVSAFRITTDELNFYKKMGLPLPQLCHNCRTFERLQQRTGLALYKRKCQCGGLKSENGVYQNTAKHLHVEDGCSNEFETSYAPDRPEIVYCEQCYQQEIL